jgi:protein-S-isoprenylcysteine O-methyltransferase Ste14
MTSHTVVDAIVLACWGLFAVVWIGGAFVLLVVFFELRIRSEELLLSESFPGAYEDYRRRVPQLIPGLRLLRSSSGS